MTKTNKKQNKYFHKELQKQLKENKKTAKRIIKTIELAKKHGTNESVFYFILPQAEKIAAIIKHRFGIKAKVTDCEIAIRTKDV